MNESEKYVRSQELEGETVKVGWVQRAHGLFGEVYIHLYNPEPDWLNELKSLTLRSSSGVPLKCLTKRVRPHKKGLIIECLGIEDRQAAEDLKGYSMEIPRNCLKAKEEGEMYLNEVFHFQVVVEGRGVIGRVEEFISHKAQDLLVIQGREYHYQIPFVDDYIRKICFETSQIHLQLPEGLLELFEG